MNGRSLPSQAVTAPLRGLAYCPPREGVTKSLALAISHSPGNSRLQAWPSTLSQTAKGAENEPRIAFIATPILVFTYGVVRIVDGLDGSRGPRAAWTLGHLAFIGALALFIIIFWQLRRLIGRSKVALASAVAGTFGAMALIAQFTIDIVAGLMSVNRQEMEVIFDQVATWPAVQPVVYDFGPYFFYLGQLALVIHLALARKVKMWTPALVLADLAMPFIDKDLIPVGAVLLLISFVPLAFPGRYSLPQAQPRSA